MERAQVLVARFWETYEELEPWLGETETLIGQLPPPAIDTETLRQQQDQMRVSEAVERPLDLLHYWGLGTPRGLPECYKAGVLNLIKSKPPPYHIWWSLA